MKYGATTVHRAFGIGVGRFPPMGNKHSRRAIKVITRLKRARVCILDEISMIGRRMHGKIAHRTSEALGHEPHGFGERTVSMGGLDVIETGDFKQAAPISDESLFTEGAYRGKSVGDTNDCMTPAQLTQVGLHLRDEFRDVVILRNVHRRERRQHAARRSRDLPSRG